MWLPLTHHDSWSVGRGRGWYNLCLAALRVEPLHSCPPMHRICCPFVRQVVHPALNHRSLCTNAWWVIRSSSHARSIHVLWQESGPISCTAHTTHAWCVQQAPNIRLSLLVRQHICPRHWLATWPLSLICTWPAHQVLTAACCTATASHQHLLAQQWPGASSGSSHCLMSHTDPRRLP